MKAAPEVSWRLEDGAGGADIDAALAPRFATEWREPAVTARVCYDDADATLWHAGCVLFGSDPGGLCLLRDGEPVAESPPPAGERLFWWDVPEGALRAALRPLVGVRALLPVATHEVSRHELLLQNQDRKTVVRGSLTRSVVDGQCLQYLTLTPMRGYDDEFESASRGVRQLVHALADVDLQTLLAGHRIAAFAAARVAPMPIADGMPTEQAVRAMAHVMLEQAQRHVDGVVRDIDTEFLHAYRVSLRKARSLVSLMKKSLPEAALDTLKPRLSRMAGTTNALRDLDVYLLAHHEYAALLPAGFAPGMDELTALVRARRAQAHAQVAAYFASPAYRDDVDACLAELALPPVLATPMAARPVLGVVKRQVLRRYAAIEALAAAINPESADDDVHALRIEFKKLRYLIEFFIDLLPKKRSMKVVADFKKIQGVLGAFNDLSVQIDFLEGFQDPRRGAMTQALGGLTAILHMKKTDVRARIGDALAAYFTENRAIEFGLLFGARQRDKRGTVQ